MKKKILNKNVAVAFLGLLCLIATSCKKNKDIEIDTPATPSTGTATRAEQTLDSLFLYAKQVYFWNTALPEYSAFNPRRFAGTLSGYNQELYAITQYSPINTATGKPYEYPLSASEAANFDAKYSYINDLTLANPNVSAGINDKAAVDTEGNGNDIGIRPVYYLTSNSESGPYLLFVTAVYPSSPAEAAGVKRGWVITKVNGNTIGNNFTTENSTISAAFNAASVKIEGYNFLDKVAFSLTLNKASYKSSPVYLSKVFTRSGKKIGYLSYARFSSLTNETVPSDSNLDPVFTEFSSQGVTDLIIDLRYNGGGYVNSAEYLANLIAPAGLTGKTMFVEYYNSLMQSNGATLLKNQPLIGSDGKIRRQDNGTILTYANVDYSVAGNTVLFKKKGNLNTVTNVVFIVSRNTASASELLINSLKPYMTVQLVGETTYGKPVGFFPITLENRYEVYMSSFETKNSSNEGGYYSGMIPGTLSNENPSYVFGDEREVNLLAALNLIAPAAANQGARSSVAERSTSTAVFNAVSSKPVNPNSEFNGMIENRYKLKK